MRLVAGLGKDVPKSMDQEERNHYELSIAKLKAELYKTQLSCRELEAELRELRQQELIRQKPPTVECPSQTREEKHELIEKGVQTSEESVSSVKQLEESSVNDQAQPITINIENVASSSSSSTSSDSSSIS